MSTAHVAAEVVADVLIVGAGPTGLALGVDLARRGVDALVVEKADGLFPGSRGKGIQPRTMEVLEDLGVLDAVLARGGPYPVGMIWQDGKRVGEHRMFDPADLKEATADSAFTVPWMVPQWRTQEILFARLEELGGRVEFGREVVGLDQDDLGVSVRFTSGPELRARYVVAADGGRSAVRRALGVGMTGETVDPNPVLVSDVRITGLDRDNWHVFPPSGEGDDGYLAICPLAGTDDFQLVAQFPEGTAVDLSLDGIRKVAAARSHLAPEDITEVRWASDFRPRAALADRFRAGRVFLAGDAAHVHSSPAARASTPASRTPTTWAGSWARCCAAGRTRSCWTPTRRSGAPSPRRCSASPPACTAARCGAARQPSNWGSDTGSRPSPRRHGRTRGRYGRATAHPTRRSRAYGSSTHCGDRTGHWWRWARTHPAGAWSRCAWCAGLPRSRTGRACSSYGRTVTSAGRATRRPDSRSTSLASGGDSGGTRPAQNASLGT